MRPKNPLIKPDFIPRVYQEKIASEAVKKNTLVVLPTGVGKTAIAAIVAAERLVERPSSKVLFLAPTKPLAVQHQKTFGLLLDIGETAVLTGEIPTENRRSLWEENRIIFATPQAIENDILRGLKLEDVSLTVFDEAHRALGDYSYVHIAGEYAKNKDHRILALTASPSSNKEKIDEILKNLRVNQIEARGEGDPDVKPYIQNIKTTWVKVDLPPEFLKIKKMIEDILKDSLTELKESGYMKTTNMKKINKKSLLEVQAKIRGGNHERMRLLRACFDDSVGDKNKPCARTPGNPGNHGGGKILHAARQAEDKGCEKNNVRQKSPRNNGGSPQPEHAGIRPP